MYRYILLLLSILPFCIQAAPAKVYNLKDYGVTPRSAKAASAINAALQRIKQDANGSEVTVRLEKGTYRLSPDDAPDRIYYISNHDQVVHHPTGVAIEGWEGLTFDGAGSTLLCEGRMLPMSIVGCTDVTVKNLHIDFATPHISQVTIVSNDDSGITFRPSSEVNWEIDDQKRFTAHGKDWTLHYYTGIAFDGNTYHIVPQTSDLSINLSDCSRQGDLVKAPNWKDSRLPVGTRLALRSYHRPHPAVFMEADIRTLLRNVSVHYAEGMGLVAQMCTDIHLDGFNVCLAKGSQRYFTTQADATHFVQCRGKLISENGLYEGMMDDAINVHGVYLRVRQRIKNRTLRCRFEHNQTFGYKWGEPGDSVVFVRSATMDQLPFTATIRSINTAGGPIAGTLEYIITLDRDLPEEISDKEGYGIENITWTPEVVFRNSTVRNNRARGALFSSARATMCEDNFFDHTSGTAILLCGDCNGWYESGPVRNIVIRRNRFLNALTNMFQFTNAVISIYPEIPNIKESKTYFHGGSENAIVICDNIFETFDSPLIYAKSVDGIVVRDNKVTYNHDFKPFHWNQKAVLLEHCTRARVQDFPERK